MPPGAGPTVPLAYYNTGVTSGMASQTTYSSALSSGSGSPVAISARTAGGNAHICVASLVAGSLVVILLFHILGFRFAFDVDVGRR